MPSRVWTHRLSGGQHHVGAPRTVVVPLGQEGVEGVLAGVPPGAVATVVTQCDRLGQGDVHPDAAGDRGGDLRDLERVGEPGALVIGGVHDDLRLAGQPAERRRVDDAVAVPFEAGALRVRSLLARPLPRSDGPGGTGDQELLLACFPLLAQHGPWRLEPDAGARVGADHPGTAVSGHRLGPGDGARREFWHVFILSGARLERLQGRQRRSHGNAQPVHNELVTGRSGCSRMIVSKGS